METQRRSDARGVAPRRPSRVGWSVFAGSVAAAIVVFVLVTLAVGAVADSYGAGALMGAFCAAWGGIGFGVMFSGALAVLKDEEGAPARPQTVANPQL